LLKCQETSSITLLVWRLAAWASRQADGTQTYDSGHSASRAPSGRVSSARRNRAAETLMVRWRLAVVRVTARRGRCSDDSTGGWCLLVCDARQAGWS